MDNNYTNMIDSNTFRKILQFISNCLHPMLMSTYAAIILCCYTPLWVLPSGLKLFLIVEVLFYTCVIPFITIWLLYKLHLVGHYALRDRKDRGTPLFASLLAYIVCAYSLSRHGFIPIWGMNIYYGSVIITLIAWIVSFKWKISGHALAISGLTTAVWVLYILFPYIMPIWLPFILLILTGLLCSIRVYLGRHTLAQVSGGTLVGFTVIETLTLLLH